MHKHLNISIIIAIVLFYALGIPWNCFGGADVNIPNKSNTTLEIKEMPGRAPPPFEIVLVKPQKQAPGDMVTVELYYSSAKPVALADVSVAFDAIDAKISDFSQAKASIMFRVQVPDALTESNQSPRISVRVGDDRVLFAGDFELVHPGRSAEGPWWQRWLNSPVLPAILVALFLAWVSATVARRSVLKKLERLERPEKHLSSPTTTEAAAPQLEAASVAAAPTFPLPTAPDALKVAISGGKCILVIGSGMNAQAGLMTWQEMLRRVVINALDDKKGAYYLQELDNGRVDAVAESLRSVLGADSLARYVTEMIPQRLEGPSPYSALRDIEFAGVVSLNYDTLAAEAIPQATVSSYSQARRVLDQLSRGEPFVLQLNGTANDMDMLFSNQDLRDASAHNEALGELLQRLYYSYTFLFLGVSLDGVQAFYRPIERTSLVASNHFALLEAADDSFEHRARNLETFRVEVLPFNVADRDTAVKNFVGSLAGAPAEAGSTQADSKIASVELRNIGPFVHEVFEFDKTWNVILGDNGVGKSTILKAIAICACGRESARYAERVLRRGATSGEIVLQIGGRSYVTAIKQESEGGVVVESLSGVPYQLEGVLIVGFSALRSIGWERPRNGGKPGAARPLAEDILPLITGERDPRLDGVKQLILRLDHSVESKDTPETDRRRYQALYARLFDMFKELAHGVKIERGPVDAQASEILIVTQDGTVPFEALSQGTLSLVSWTGALLQRLYEVTREGQEPTQSAAIVLIDEIDAHMHPAWQRTLVSRLSALFPNIQFIATSHSPLMVGSLEPSQVYRLARDTSGSVIKERPDYVLKGLGVAGLLTSNLFGLDSHLDEPTEDALNRKRELVAKVMAKSITPEEETELVTLNKKVRDIDFTHSLRDQAFEKLKESLPDDERANEDDSDDDLTGEEKAARERILNETLQQLMSKDAKK